MYEYSGTIISDLAIIKCFLEEILNEVHCYIDNDDLMFDIKLILNELVVNSALHGNKLKPTKKIKIELEIRDEFIKIIVEDEGRGINYDLKNYNPANLNCTGNCSGRGLILVHGLSDEFIIDKNRIIVVKEIC